MDFQVVLKDDKVLWAVAPPLADERDTAAVTKKYGVPIEAKGDVHVADTLRAWQVLAYPAKGLAFVHAPGDTAIVARIVRKAP